MTDPRLDVVSGASDTARIGYRNEIGPHFTAQVRLGLCCGDGRRWPRFVRRFVCRFGLHHRHWWMDDRGQRFVCCRCVSLEENFAYPDVHPRRSHL